MPRASEFLESFQSGAPALPARISSQYQCVSALGHRPEGGAFLLRRMEDGARFVLKAGSGEQDLAEEFRLLKRLRKGLAPEAVDFFEEDGVQYLIRTYIPGQPLAEAWEPGADPGLWAELGAQLCSRLAELHNMDPPIVHRDIKPENIILTPEGTPVLIDFGIARSYKPGRETDTTRMGTPATAAPEQYGFSQSGPRTDLYALGVTLRWMVTGSYRAEALEDANCPGWVKRFLKRAAAFDPANRFPSASAMAEALRRHSVPSRRKRMLLAAAICLAAVLGVTVWYAERRRPVDFGSPLLEAAVRAELGRSEGAITRADLKEVRRLAVVGQELLGEEQSFRCNLCVYVGEMPQYDVPRGDISDLSLLSRMPNLTTLYLCRQEISDFSPLEDLPLRELYLVDNYMEDFSPLERMPDLEVLYIGTNPAVDYTPIASLKNLRELNLDFWGMHEPESLAPLAGLPVESLSLGNLYPRDGNWSFLGTLGNLRALDLWDPLGDAMAALADCEHLGVLSLGNYRETDLAALPAIPGLYALNILNRLPSIEGIQKQPDLAYLSLCNQEGVDLAPAAALPALKELYIYNVSSPGYAPLLEAPELEQVVVDTEAVREAVETDCPGRRFEISIS